MYVAIQLNTALTAVNDTKNITMSVPMLLEFGL